MPLSSLEFVSLLFFSLEKPSGCSSVFILNLLNLIKIRSSFVPRIKKIPKSRQLYPSQITAEEVFAPSEPLHWKRKALRSWLVNLGTRDSFHSINISVFHCFRSAVIPCWVRCLTLKVLDHFFNSWKERFEWVRGCSTEMLSVIVLLTEYVTLKRIIILLAT